MILASPPHSCFSRTMSDHDFRRDRPTLPPIRDLFREISGTSRPHESPALTLARLSVSDDDEEPSLMSSHSLSQPNLPRTYQTYSASSRTSFERSPLPMSPRLISEPTSSYGWSTSSSPRNPPRLLETPLHSHSSRDRSWSHDAYQAKQRHRSQSQLPHRNTISTTDFRYDPRASRGDDTTPVAHTRPPLTASYGQRGDTHLQHPLALSTASVVRRSEEDEQTPVGPSRSARQGPAPGPSARSQASGTDEGTSSGPVAKYECSYCGKGFNRPSSLKIHLNSHTGEKPFVCPVEGCGRCFSVLSNMRRHARVHNQSSRTHRRDSSDEGSERLSPPATASSLSSHHSLGSAASSRWHQRRLSTASASSTSSRRSRSSISDGEDEGETRPEKRTRH